MASELGWVGLGVSPDFTGFKGKVESESSKAMAAAGVSGGTAFGESAGKSAGAKFKSAIKSAAKVAAVGFAAAGALAIKFGSDALDEAREAQKVGALTASTIKATGGAAKVTATHVGNLSEKISEQAGVDDEIIQRGANMLLTFKNVRNEAGKGGKIFDRTTQAITDMAAGMAGGKGGELDLKSASILMGKALNDPVKGLTAMTRVGIQFTDQQKAINLALVEGGEVNALNALGMTVTAAEFADAMEKHKRTAEEQARVYTGPLSDAQQKYFEHLTEGGHTLEAQKNILKEVNSQFKGAAAAQATDAEKLAVAWGNFKEEVGNELLPVMDDLTNFLREKGIPKAREFFGWVKDEGVPAFKDLKDYLEPIAKDALPGITDALNAAKGVAKGAAPIIGGLFEGFSKLPDDVKRMIVLASAGGFAAKKFGLIGGGSGGALKSALGMAKPVPVFVTNQGFGATTGTPGAGGGKPSPATKGTKFSGARNFGRAILPFALADAAYEAGVGDLYGLDDTPNTQSPIIKAGGGAFGAGLQFSQKGSLLGKTFKDGSAMFDGVVKSTEVAGEAVDLMGLRIGTALNTAKGRVESFDDRLTLVGSRKVRPEVELRGIDRARAQVDGLMGALDDLAGAASSGIDAAGATVVGAVTGRGNLHRNRRRNLGGMP